MLMGVYSDINTGLMQTSQNMIQKPHSVKQETGMIAFFVYLAIFLAPNGKLFIIRISEGFHLTPIRAALFIIGTIITLHVLNKKFNIIAIIRRFSLFLPLILLIIIKITSLLYSYNYLGGIAVIEWFIEDIFFAVVCYIYYVKGIIVPSKIILSIVAGFVLSISMALIQIGNFALNFNFLWTLINYINANTPDVQLFQITGLYIGDTNSYATYVASVLITFIAVMVYSKKYLLGTTVLFLVASAVLFSLQSRSSIIIFILVFIYMIIRDKVIQSKQGSLLMLIFLTFLSIIMTLPSDTSEVFFQKYSQRYIRLIDYINKVDYEEEGNYQSHKDMLSLYFDNIDREPIAIITGVGEGDYLNIGGGGQKR